GARPRTVASPGGPDPKPGGPAGAAGAGADPVPTAADTSKRPLSQPVHEEAVWRMRSTAWPLVRPWAKRRASAPETWAAAIDVPARVAYRPSVQSDTTSSLGLPSAAPPGAARPHFADPSALE